MSINSLLKDMSYLEGYKPEFQFKILKTPSDVEFEDVMKGLSNYHIEIDNIGFVSLVDVMPRLVPKGRTGDFCIPQAARTSTGSGCKSIEEDKILIRYLKRHEHGNNTKI